MLNKVYQKGFLPKNKMQLRVPGLRDYAPPSDVRVFKMNTDGSKGEYLRTEESKESNETYFNE